MSNNLYLEAIEAAEEIKHAAEENVKQRLIESMTPQIKLLVEKKIFEKEEEILKDNKKDDEEANDVEEYCKIESVDENKINDVLIKNAQFTETLLRLRSIKEGINNLKKAKTLIEGDGNKVNENKKYVQLYKLLLSEVNKLKSNSIIKNNDDLLKQFYNINEEIHNMSKRRSYNELDHLLEMNLFEEEEADITDDEEADIDLDSGDESGDEGDEMPDVEIDEMPDVDEDQGDAEALQQIIDIAEKALDDSEDMGSEEEPEGDAEDDELQLDGLYEIDEMANENEHDNLDAALEESRRRDRVLEIDENMLRREIGKMKAIREGEAKDMASHFGGGSIEGEAFVDGVTLNKLHEVKIKASKVVRKNRMLSSKLTQYKKALRGMKSQLSEMNLFNAKLLYANKLMQNRDLSMKQQRHIVESLDDANTIGEAKILFESLSKSLVSKRPATSGKNLSEGAFRRKSGAASAPVRSGQSKPLNESVALDRWATLAGIKK